MSMPVSHGYGLEGGDVYSVGLPNAGDQQQHQHHAHTHQPSQQQLPRAGPSTYARADTGFVELNGYDVYPPAPISLPAHQHHPHPHPHQHQHSHPHQHHQHQQQVYGQQTYPTPEMLHHAQVRAQGQVDAQAQAHAQVHMHAAHAQGHAVPTHQHQHLQQQQHQHQQFVSAYGTMPGFNFPGIALQHPGEVWREDWADEHADSLHTIENIEVKHRRRTTPDQLKVLEFWYDINPKPDNALREQLAGQLGMTKRNVQVWFQNRRAKMKGLAKKEAEEGKKRKPEDETSGESSTTPGEAGNPSAPTPISATSTASSHLVSILQPPNAAYSANRRVSLAGDEVAKIEMFVAKRAAAAQKQGEAGGGSGYASPVRSPHIGGQANLARRSSIPYPMPISFLPPAAVGTAAGSMSPKFSPASTRVGPSALHIAAIRNNTRRASMPGVGGLGASQLISSGPFTPPRVVTNKHQVGSRVVSVGDGGSGNGGDGAGGARELSPITDQETYADVDVYGDSRFSAALYGTGSGGVHDILPLSYLPPAEGTFDASLPFSPDSPLPNPTFSFGDGGATGGYMFTHQLQQQSLAQAQPGSHNPGQGQAGQTGQAPPPPPLHLQNPPQSQQQQDDEAARQQQVFMAIQQRGRMGSLASIGTLTTEAGTEGDESVDWLNDLPQGFVPDMRRASAPPDLLHQIGMMGLSASTSGGGGGGGGSGGSCGSVGSVGSGVGGIRPSPLGSHFTTPDSAYSRSQQRTRPPPLVHPGSHHSSTPSYDASSFMGHAHTGHQHSSEAEGGSSSASEDPSPTGAHSFGQQQQQQQQQQQLGSGDPSSTSSNAAPAPAVVRTQPLHATPGASGSVSSSAGAGPTPAPSSSSGARQSASPYTPQASAPGNMFVGYPGVGGGGSGGAGYEGVYNFGQPVGELSLTQSQGLPPTPTHPHLHQSVSYSSSQSMQMSPADDLSMSMSMSMSMPMPMTMGMSMGPMGGMPTGAIHANHAHGTGVYPVETGGAQDNSSGEEEEEGVGSPGGRRTLRF